MYCVNTFDHIQCVVVTPKIMILKTENRPSFQELKKKKKMWRVKAEIAKCDTQLTKTCDHLRSVAACSVAVG